MSLRACVLFLAVSLAAVGARSATRAVSVQRTPPAPARPPRTDNLVALEMGGRIESRLRIWDEPRDPIMILDGDPTTVWATRDTTTEIVLSFLARDSALVSGVTITVPAAGVGPDWFGRTGDEVWPKDMEIWTSVDSATSGFQKAATTMLPRQPGDHAIVFTAPVQARFVKLVIKSNYGSTRYTLVADVKVTEGQAPGYVPFLSRHKDLASLISSGVLPVDRRATGGSAPAASAPAALEGDVCAPPSPPAVAPAHPESRSVLVVSDDAEMYAPYYYSRVDPDSPRIRYFPGPGDGLVDSSIIRRATFWPVAPTHAAPAALVPGSGVDTVVLLLVCDIKTSVSDSFKRALIAWVAAGHKLIIQDSDKCGPAREPDYSFLPFPFATSNPGAQGAASRLNILENNFVVSPDPASPAFFDEESWRLTTNGNWSNDFGDSNTVFKYDSHWCGAMSGMNANHVPGYVLTYAHHGSGVILYDGVDTDQRRNLAYRQYVLRQLLLPFDPDGMPCSLRLAPIIVTTDVPLMTRAVAPGQTYTYPITVFSNQGVYKGPVRLSLSTSPALGGLVSRFEPDTVTLGTEATSTLTVTLPATLPEALPGSWRLAIRGEATGARTTLCLTANMRRTGRLTVASDLGSAAASPSQKNLLIVLDLSGSMNLALGKSTRIATARQVLRDVLKRIPDDFNVGLRLYGHRYGSRQKETCTDSELVVPVHRLDRDAILKTVDRFRPRGETPLVYSILQAPADLRSPGGGNVVLITDGEESCGGDFSAATSTLRQSGLQLRLNIVGFTLKGQSARQQLGAIAAATGGSYYAAEDGAALTRALVAVTISRFPYSVLSASGAVVATGEAGDKGQELPPGDYKIVIQAGDEKLVIDRVSIATGRDATVRIVRKGDRFALER